jgi:1-phosphatidylinositol phosphodiesterase
MWKRLSFFFQAALSTLGTTGAVGVTNEGSVNCKIGPALEQNKNKEWMKDIPDDILISELSIPGTHDSCALYGGPHTICQAKSLLEQLELGIRFFDIRCRALNNKFALVHGMIDQHQDFGSALHQLLRYLRHHPKEFIFIRVKEEAKADNKSKEFVKIFEDYLEKVGGPDSGKFYMGTKVPTVGEVRGKIVLFDNFGYGKGIEWNNTQSLCLQDKYRIANKEDLIVKKQQIKATITEYQQSKKDKIYINFCSGHPGSAALKSLIITPKKIAKQTNKLILESTGSLGVIAMDFPGDEVVREIILRNQALVRRT